MNLFGLNINVNLRDRASSGVRALGEALTGTRRHATQAVESLRTVNRQAEETADAFRLTAEETEALSRIMSGTSQYATRLERDMQRLSHTLGDEIPDSTREAYSTMYMLRDEIRKTQRAFGKYSPEVMRARNRLNEYLLSMDETSFKQIYMRGQLGLTTAQLNQQANSIKLTARVARLTGNQLEIMDERMRGLQNAGVTPDMLIPASTPGVFENLNTVMSYGISPLNRLSRGHRNLASKMEKVIKNYSAIKVSVRECNGDLARQNRLMMNLTQMTANLGLALPIVGMGAFAFYKGLYSVAIETNEGFKELIDTVKGKVLKAFQPLIDVAVDVGTAFLNVVGWVADLVAKFNEAHPVIAKVLAVIGFLVPALTLLSLTVAGGVGIWKGWMVALSSIWPMISGVVSMIMTASSTALMLAGSIAVLTVGFTTLWKESEVFRNVVTNAFNKVKEVVGNAIKSMKSYFSDLSNAFKEGGWQGALDFVINSINEFLPKMYEKGSEMLKKLCDGIINNAPKIIDTALTLLQSWLNAFNMNVGLLINAGMEIINKLTMGIVNALPQISECCVNILTTIVSMIMDNAPMIIDAGIQLLTGLVEGITQAIPMLIDAVILLLEFFCQFLSDNLPIIIDSAIYILLALTQGIIDNLVVLVDACIQIILALVDGIVANLPMIIEAGVQIIVMLVQALVSQLPQLVMMGIRLITSLISGLFSAVGQLLGAVVQILGQVIQAIIGYIPQFLASGVQLIGGLINGFFQTVGEVIGAVDNIIEGAVNKCRGAIDKFTNIGGEIITGLANGIKNGISTVVDAISGVVTGAINAGKKLLGIKSPSRVFKQIGAWTSEGMAIGIDNNAPMVEHSIEDMTNDAIGLAQDITQNKSIMLDVGKNMTPTPQQVSSPTNNNTTNHFSYNITVNSQATDDSQSMARQLYEEIKRLQQLDMSMGYNNNLDIVF